MYQFTMPDIGEGTYESEVTRWFYQEGDQIAEDAILCEVSSDKAVAELPCPVSGTIAKLHYAEGEMARVGGVIADIETDEAPTESAVAPVGEPAAAPAQAPSGEAPAAAQDPADPTVDIRRIAVPRVRHYARGKGVDLTRVRGTGPQGKVTIDDVDAFLAGGQSPAEQPATTEQPTVQAVVGPSAPADDAAAQAEAPRSAPAPVARGGERREKMPSVRKIAARAMTEAAAVPTVTVLDRVEVSALVAHRDRLKGMAAKQGIKLTYTPYVVKACVAMLKKFPQLNGRVDMEAGEYVYYDTFNVGVATNTPHGLFVPVVKDADRLSLFDIAREITALGERAQSGSLARAEMSGGSMTVTNVGGAATGGVWSTPILNGSEAAIVGIGRFEEEFVPDENRQPVLKPVTKLSVTFDHRFIDGVSVQEAINALKEFLADPDLLLAES